MFEAFLPLSAVNIPSTIAFRVMKNQKYKNKERKEGRNENKKGKAPCQKEK